MKYLLKLIVSLIIFILILTGCCHKPTYRPWWYGDKGNSKYIFVYGFGEGENQASALQKADLMASERAADRIGSYIKNKIENYIYEKKESEKFDARSLIEIVSKKVFAQKISGLELIKEKVVCLENGGYLAFVGKQMLKKKYDDRIEIELKKIEDDITKSEKK